jgi:hypothetical protein
MTTPLEKALAKADAVEQLSTFELRVLVQQLAAHVRHLDAAHMELSEACRALREAGAIR